MIFKKDKKCSVALEYSADILEEINNYSSKMKYSSDYINEIFLYFYIPNFEKKQILAKKNDEDFISNLNGYDDFNMWEAAALQLQSDIKTPFMRSALLYFKSVYLLFWSFIIVVASSIWISFYTMFRFRKLTHVDRAPVAVVRAPASYQKLSFLQKEGIVFFSDTFIFNHEEVTSLYSILGVLKKISSLVYVPIYSIVDFFKIYKDAKNTIGFILTGYALLYFAKRIAHKCNFEFHLDALLKKGLIKSFYTGNKEDRFALLEKRLCNKYGVRCVCIPHGLEYAYKMPAGLVGDEFYCTSLKAKKYLSKLYRGQSISFIFDKGIVEKMFARDVKGNKERVIVFFPESREPDINLQIMEFLVDEGFKLHVKLHVKDRLENYLSVMDRINIIESFDEAISHNICLARKSTVLVEALYNHSISISVLIDNRDKSYVDLMFPSLADPMILRAETFQQLANILAKLKGKV